MNFLALQNEVLSDRFSEAKRASAKNWINATYGRMWDAEAWSFKFQVTDLPVTYNSSSVALGTIGVVYGIWDAGDIAAGGTYKINHPLRPEDFYDAYRAVNVRPLNFTVINNTLYFDNPLDQNRTYHVLSELAFTEMSGDSEIPLIPVQYHIAIAEGAAAIGLRREADPAWQAAEEAFKSGMAEMRMNWLTKVKTYEDASPSWP